MLKINSLFRDPRIKVLKLCYYINSFGHYLNNGCKFKIKNNKLRKKHQDYKI